MQQGLKMKNKVIRVMSRKEASDFSFTDFQEKTIIISIAALEESANTFNRCNPNLLGILFLRFDDVEADEFNHMTERDAERIIQFVNDNLDSADQIVVQCGAGISRSAGVAAALMLILNGDDSPIFDNPKFCPNKCCYRTLLNAFFGSFDEEEIEEKFKHNIEVWRKENLD